MGGGEDDENNSADGVTTASVGLDQGRTIHKAAKQQYYRLFCTTLTPPPPPISIVWNNEAM